MKMLSGREPILWAEEDSVHADSGAWKSDSSAVKPTGWLSRRQRRR